MTAFPSSSSPPEPGQIVRVRQRPFVVQGTLPGRLPTGRHEHLVTLSSVEEDALGDELQVVWELEPGAEIFEQMALPAPTGWDDPERLDAFLDAVRWGAISSADVDALQSPFRSGIEIEEYQLDPVARAIRMPRANLLIADDVGLGKTIEAGLVVQELILRHRVRTVLIVCPSSIQVQWQEQMRDKFGLKFRIVDSDLMRDLRRTRGIHVNPWNHFPRLITSIDFLKRDRPMRLMREVLPAQGEITYPRRFDLLIVDEAHNVAPSGGGKYATDSRRTHAVRAIVPHFEHKLFLSATPHNGYLESFTSLLEMLDDQRFARGIVPDPVQLSKVMVRRLKSDLDGDWTGAPRFAKRVLEPLEVTYTPEERLVHHELQSYTTLRAHNATLAEERFATEFVLKLLKKRLFSSPQAFLRTLDVHRESLESATKRRATRNTATIGTLRRQVEGIDEEFSDDDLYAETAHEAVDVATRLFRPLTQMEEALLDRMRTWAVDASARGDSKLMRLRAWLEEHIKPGAEWGDERVIIFTEYRDTQSWLFGKLAGAGLAGGDRLMTLYGGMDVESRERIKAAFQTDPAISPVRIMLATDAASEGINLQNHCSRLIHYEIPWNPNRMEQRNGRIDRHGQRAPQVNIYHFVGSDYRRDARARRKPGDLEGDLEFLMRAALKVEQIREDLGRVGPVIASQVEEAMLGRRADLETEHVERDTAPARTILRLQRQEQQLRDRLRELDDKITSTIRALNLTPENIEHVVRVGLEVAGQPELISINGRPGVYRMPAFRGTWAQCNEGLEHPHTREIRPITFDHAPAAGRDDVVLVHLKHPMVQRCLRLLRAEVWSPQSRQKLHRVTARLLPHGLWHEPLVIAHGRIVILGGDNERLHEEVIAAGGRLRAGRFARLHVGEVREALAAARPDPAPEKVRAQLAKLWPSHRDALLASLEARMRDRRDGLQAELERRGRQERDDVRAVLTELQRSIERELSSPNVTQLHLFKPAEQEQLRRDVEALRARAERIPKEIELEIEVMHLRYADLTPRLFPAAVEYLVPEGL